MGICSDVGECQFDRVGFIPGHSSFVRQLSIGGEHTDRKSGVSYDVSLSISRIIRANPDPPYLPCKMLNSAIHNRWTVPPSGVRSITTCTTITNAAAMGAAA